MLNFLKVYSYVFKQLFDITFHKRFFCIASSPKHNRKAENTEKSSLVNQALIFSYSNSYISYLLITFRIYVDYENQNLILLYKNNQRQKNRNSGFPD